jgi:hypothetical protein
MNIRITIQHEEEPLVREIKVSDEQKIATTLRVMSENIIGFPEIKSKKYIRVRETGRRIDTNLTYEEAGIYAGASLVVY